MSHVYSFAPLINDGSKILVLGTIPGNKSLERKEYYADPTNQFWAIIFFIFNSEPLLEYQKKEILMREKGIALWDVVKECDREGSSDSAIKAPKFNDFASLFKNHPNIRHVFFNGTKSFKMFKIYEKQAKPKFVSPAVISFQTLSSSSQSNTHKTVAAKVREWKVLKAYI